MKTVIEWLTANVQVPRWMFWAINVSLWLLIVIVMNNK